MRLPCYGWRFKIEVTFRTLIQLLWSFSYRFWMKSLPSTPRWPKNLIVDQIPEKKRPLLKRKMAAMEAFVNLNALGLGILQLLSLEMSGDKWPRFSSLVSHASQTWLSHRANCPSYTSWACGSYWARNVDPAYFWINFLLGGYNEVQSLWQRGLSVNFSLRNPS